MRLPILLLVLLVAPISAQQATPRLTADDYARAERMLAPAVTPLMTGTASQFTWQADGRLTYRTSTPDGARVVTVDIATGACARGRTGRSRRATQLGHLARRPIRGLYS